MVIFFNKQPYNIAFLSSEKKGKIKNDEKCVISLDKNAGGGKITSSYNKMYIFAKDK